MNDDLIREVNEAMKVDRAREIWNTHGKHIMALAIAMVMLVSGFLYWQQQQHEAHQQWTARLMDARTAFKQGDYEKAHKSYQTLVKESEGLQRQMAGVWLAKTELKLANQKGVLDALHAVIAEDDSKKPSAFAALACLQGAALAPEDERFATCLTPANSSALQTLKDEHRATVLLAKGEVKAAKEALPKGALSPDQQRRMDDIASYLASKTPHDD